MATEKASKRQTIAKHHKVKWIVSMIILGLVVASAVVGVCYLVLQYNKTPEVIEETTPPEEPKEEEPEPEPLPDKIDYQPIVDEWVESVSGNRSVLIYDLDRDEVVGEYNTKEDYDTASLYKLFVVYEGYRRVQSGEWNGEDIAGSTGYTIAKCLDLAIRESYSLCAETLWAKIGHENLEEIIENDFNITNSDISHLTSNPEDITKILKIFYDHEEITDEELIAQMKDSFLVQPKTTYDWRQGLPSGFKKADVYNKVGWDYNPNGGYWNIYHDAAIVEFPDENRHYIVVVMTNRVPFQKIRDLGSQIEATFYES